MEVAVADHGLIRCGGQRIVVGGVELDRYGVPGCRDVLTQCPVHLRHHTEGERVLDGMGSIRPHQPAALQQLSKMISRRCLSGDRLGTCHAGMDDRRVGRSRLHRQCRGDVRRVGYPFGTRDDKRRVTDRDSVGRDQCKTVLPAQDEWRDSCPTQCITAGEQVTLAFRLAHADRDLSHSGHRLEVGRPD